MRNLQKKNTDPMPRIDAKQMTTVVQSTAGLDRNRLDTWKEIAVYLGRAVRTAQRWAKLEGLPVHRHFHAKASTIYAFKHEVDAWMQMRRPPVSEPAPEMEHSQRAAECLNRKLVATLREVVRSRSWLQSDSPGVGAIDLLPGGNRIRVFF